MYIPNSQSVVEILFLLQHRIRFERRGRDFQPLINMHLALSIIILIYPNKRFIIPLSCDGRGLAWQDVYHNNDNDDILKKREKKLWRVISRNFTNAGFLRAFFFSLILLWERERSGGEGTKQKETAVEAERKPIWSSSLYMPRTAALRGHCRTRVLRTCARVCMYVNVNAWVVMCTR